MIEYLLALLGALAAAFGLLFAGRKLSAHRKEARASHARAQLDEQAEVIAIEAAKEKAAIDADVKARTEKPNPKNAIENAMAEVLKDE